MFCTTKTWTGYLKKTLQMTSPSLSPTIPKSLNMRMHSILKRFKIVNILEDLPFLTGNHIISVRAREGFRFPHRTCLILARDCVHTRVFINMTQFGDEWSENSLPLSNCTVTFNHAKWSNNRHIWRWRGGEACMLSCIEWKYVYRVYIKTSMHSISF